jgi:hypothetical protein
MEAEGLIVTKKATKATKFKFELLKVESAVVPVPPLHGPDQGVAYKAGQGQPTPKMAGFKPIKKGNNTVLTVDETDTDAENKKMPARAAPSPTNIGQSIAMLVSLEETRSKKRADQFDSRESRKLLKEQNRMEELAIRKLEAQNKADEIAMMKAKMDKGK